MSLIDNLRFWYYSTSLPEVVESVGTAAEKGVEIAKEKIQEGVQSFSEDLEREAERCAEWSDDRLRKAIRNTNSLSKKLAYMKELKDRGYGTEEIE